MSTKGLILDMYCITGTLYKTHVYNLLYYVLPVAATKIVLE